MKSRSPHLFLFSAVIFVPFAQAQEIDYKWRLGLEGAEYTDDTGATNSSATQWHRNGYVAGTSNRYDFGTPNGHAAWVADLSTGTSLKVGIYDPDHTGTDGRQVSNVWRVNGSGIVAGTSASYWESNISVGTSTWLADASTGVTHEVGLRGAGYVSNFGHETSSFYSLSSSGIAAGYTNYYGPSGTLPGRATWLADGNTGITTRVGLFDAGYTAASGEQFSTLLGLSQSGVAFGSSSRFDSSAYHGNAVWIATQAGTQRIGYTDADHTNSQGYQHSIGYRFIGENSVAGTSERFSGSSFMGQSAWVTDVGDLSTQRIGLFDADHVRSDGFQTSSIMSLAATEALAGSSTRYSGSVENGSSAWVWNASDRTTTRVGLTGGEFTSSSGREWSSVSALTNSGFVTGSSEAFDGANSRGSVVWMADTNSGTGSFRIGLQGPEYMEGNNYGYQGVTHLTETGIAGGTAAIYDNAGLQTGSAAWVANASTGNTQRVGLTGSRYVDATTGEQYHSISRLMNSGVIVGGSNAYHSSGYAGVESWVATVGSPETTRVGLYGGAFENTDASFDTQVTHVTESGYVTGYSSRYNYGNLHGQTAWIYDSASGLQTAFELFVNAGNGYSHSEVDGITEDGLAYGTYYGEGSDASLRDLAFIWTEASGVITLDEELSSELLSNGWASLSGSSIMLDGGYLLGWGSLSGGGQGVFVAQVPEVSTTLLAFAALPLLFRRRKTA